jgi:long-chain fatty acid transport protein
VKILGRRWLQTSAVAIVAITLSAGDAFARAGYSVSQESVSGAGVAYSGGTAAGTDASIIWSNPAAMTLFDRSQIVFGAHFLSPDVDYDEINSTLGNTRLIGGEGGQGGVDIAIPHLYGLWSYSPDLKFGIGINTPYGLRTDYNVGWIGRYNELTTALTTFNVNPALGYRINNKISIGGGFNVSYARARLTQAIDFGSICVAALGAVACNGLGLAPQQNDGIGEFRGSDIDWGYNLGVLYEWSPRTRFGASFRSKQEYEFDGDGVFGVPAAAQAILAAGQFVGQRANAKLPIPPSASLSAYHDVNGRWAVMADVTWTGWSTFEEVRINFAFPSQPANVIRTEWNNVFRVAGGATYAWNEQLMLRSGLAFDESPISTAFRGPGIPDSDRIIIAVGAGYKLREGLTIDAGYQHLFFSDGFSNRISPTGSVTRGVFKVDVDVFTMGATWTF